MGIETVARSEVTEALDNEGQGAAIHVLKSGQLTGAALDVFEAEPLPEKQPPVAIGQPHYFAALFVDLRKLG